MRLLLFCVLWLASVSSFASNYKIYHLDLQGECVSNEVVHNMWQLWANSYGTAAFNEMLGDYDVTGSGSRMSRKSRFALEQLELTIDFFKAELNWDVIGGQEKILLISNFESGSGGDCSALNAFYNGYNQFHLMGIELGHPNSSQSMADDLDNASHEYGHGYYREYKREQTHEDEALNESVADMFGAAFKAWAQSTRSLSSTRIRENTFWVGEVWAQIARNYYGADVQLMRDMGNPSTTGDPDYYNRREASNTEIHSLGGVTNLAFALMAQGGSHPNRDNGIRVQGIGMEKSIKLIAYALRHRLPFNSMPEFGDAIRKSAMRIHGRNSHEFKAVDAAFRAVGLTSSLPAPRPESTPQPTAEPRAEQEQTPTPLATSEPTPQPTLEPIPETKLTISGPVFIMVLLGGIALVIVIVGIILNRRKQPYQPIDESAFAPPPPSADLYQAEKKGTPDQTEKINPHFVAADKYTAKINSGGIGVTLTVEDKSFALQLDGEQVILGRGSDLDLPSTLLQQLSADSFMSRKHCAVWYKNSTGELYVQSLSENGLTVKGNKISGRDKVKLNFNRPVTLVLGKTSLTLIPN